MKTRNLMLSVMTVMVLVAASSMVYAKDVGVLWMGNSGMATRVFTGFEEGMKEFAPDVNLEVKEELSKDEGPAVYDEFQKSKDAVVFLRSSGAKHMGQNPPSIPGFFGGCNNPVTLGATSSMSDPDKNSTGVTYYLSAEKQFDIYKKLFPKMTSVGILLEKGHPGAAIDSKDTKDAAAKFGFKYTDVTVSTQEELASGVKTLKDKGADIIIIGSMGMIIDGTDKVIAAAGSTPVVSYAEKSVKKGALAGLVPSDAKLGKLLAKSVADVLNGKSVKQVPVKTDPAPKLYINKTTMMKLKVMVPIALLKTATLID